MNPDVARLLDLLSPAVLLNVKRGTKEPSEKMWQDLTIEDMSPHYLGKLVGNIGVSLGKASKGLHSIDCDDEATFTRLLELNPSFLDTLQSHGQRGGNFWLRVEGDAPKTGHYCRQPKSKDSHLGEWRGTGGQTVIHGKHPSGIDYRNNGKRPITIKFTDIVWPDDWWLPWHHYDEPPATSRQGQSARQVKDRLVVETMLASIPKRPDYDLWLKISAAVRNSLGNEEEAISLLQAWSPEEERGEYAKHLSSSPFKEISFGTLVHHAAENGFSGAVKRFFYNTSRFGMQGRSGFVPLTGSDAVKEHLAKLGIPKNARGNVLCDIRETQYVDYIGPLGGHMPGVRKFNGSKMVVTSAPTIIEAKKGTSPFLDKLFHDLLYDPQNPDQLPTFLNWLAHCRRAVLQHKRTQTPAVAFTGSKGDGKSLAIEVINRCLGGRAANGYNFFSGKKDFNGDMAGVELIIIDDAAASKDHRARVHLAQSIKSNQFAAGVRIEAKNREAINLDPVQAIVIAVNRDPEELLVLPELTDSMEDKIMLLSTKRSTFFDTQEENSAALDAELPAFLHKLETRDLSDAYELTSKRLRCFWHPDVLESVGKLSNERQLLELAHSDDEIFSAIKNKGEWVGTAAKLEAVLTCQLNLSCHQARKLLGWSAACGTYLGRLADKPGTGVYRDKMDAKKIQTYRITEPPEEVRGGTSPPKRGKVGGKEVVEQFISSISDPRTSPSLTKTTNKHPNSLLPSYSHTDARAPGPHLWDMWSFFASISPGDPSNSSGIEPTTQVSLTTSLPPDFDPEFEAEIEAAAEADLNRQLCLAWKLHETQAGDRGIEAAITQFGETLDRESRAS